MLIDNMCTYKDISLYDYLMNSKKLKKYEERLKNIEQKLTEKLK